MEEKGLITREKNPNDGRGVIIKLTPLGLEKRELSKDKVKRFNEAIRKHLTEEQIANFIAVTETINQLIADKAIFDSKK